MTTYINPIRTIKKLYYREFGRKFKFGKIKELILRASKEDIDYIMIRILEVCPTMDTYKQVIKNQILLLK